MPIIPNSERTPEELHAITVKGGIASGKARREKKLMKEQLEMLLSLPLKNKAIKDGIKQLGIKIEDINNQMAIVLALYRKALKGDTKAFELIRDTIGEKPQDNINLNGNLDINNPYKDLTTEELREIIKQGSGSDG